MLRGMAAPPLRPGPLVELPAAVPARYVGGAGAADTTPEEGYAAGFAHGHAEGYEEGLALAAAEAAEGRRRLDRAWSALAVAARGLEQRTALELSGLSQELAETAIALAEAVVGREVACAQSPGADALARALALAPSGVAVVARLHPGDAAVVGEGHPKVPAGVTVIADPSVEPGGCLLDAGDCRIDAQLGPALARARAALLGEDA